MFGLSAGEITLVLLIVGLVFGWSWIPRLAERVGDLVGGVKKGLREDDPGIVVKQAPPKSASKKDPKG